jgi:hypothetical protein
LLRYAFLAASCLLAASTTAAAQTGPAATTPPSQTTTVAPVTAKANSEEKVVCKYQTPVGSRLGGKRVCMTQADWKAQELDARRQRDFAPPAGISGSH